MMLGARTGAWAKSGGWVNPYITDGLASMFDSVWNVGGGLSDRTSDRWFDVVSPAYIEFENFKNHDDAKIEWTDNALEITHMNGVGHGMTPVYGAFYNIGSATIEFVARNNGNNKNRNYIFGIWNNGTYAMYTIYVGSAKVVSNGSASEPRCLTNELASFSFVCDGSDTLFYRNGEYKGVESNNTFVERDILDEYVAIGDRYEFSDFTFLGAISSIRIYSKPLSAEQIAANYAVDKARFNLS